VLSTASSSARSAYEILGLPSLPGLPPLPEGQAGKLPFIDQRVELVRLLAQSMNETAFRRIKKKVEAGEGNDAEKTLVATHEPQPSLLDWPDVDAFLDRVEASVPPARKAFFAQHRLLARHGAEHGVLPEGVPRLDLNDAERQLLWAATLIHAFANDKIQRSDFTFHPLVKAVTSSRFVDGMFNRLAFELPGQCRLIAGAPGSWFYFSPDSKMPRINLDLCHCLITGGGLYEAQGGYLGHYEPIAHHEIGHAKLSKFYPESMQKIWSRMASLAAKGGMKLPDAFMPDGSPKPTYPSGSKVTVEEFKEFMALHAEFTMRQRFWNACEDNCVNRYSVNLGDPEHIATPALRHKGNLADSQNVFRTIQETAPLISKYFAPKEKLDKKGEGEEEKAPDASQRLANLSHAVNMAFYFRNRLSPDTSEGRASIGVQLDLLPAETPEEQVQMWEYIKDVTRRIEGLQPHALDGPGRMYRLQDPNTKEMHLVNYDGEVKLYNRWRNEEIEKLLRLADPLIAEIMKQKKQQIEKAVEDMKKNPQQQQGGEGNGGEGMEVEGLGEKESDMPSSTPQGQGKQDHDKRTGASQGDQDKEASQSETSESRRKREVNGEDPDDKDKKEGEGKPKGKDPYAHTPRNVLPMNSPAQQGAGSQKSAIEKLVLGDGRSYRDLRGDTDYVQASGEVAGILQELSERVSKRVKEVRPTRFDLPGGGGNLLERLDQDRMEQLGNKLAQGRASLDDFRTMRQEEIVTKPVVHDIVLLMDGSGSMGTGAGSRMEIAMKTAALAYDGLRKLQMQDTKNVRYRLFMSLWGDEEDWAKDKEAANKYLIAEPGMKDSEVEARIERVLTGISSGTLLAPAFHNILNRMTHHPLPAGQKHGMTHFIIPTDGELYDENASREAIDHVLKIMPNATVDVLVTANNGKNKLRDLMTEMKQRHHGRVGVVDADWQHAPSQVVALLKSRQRSGEMSLDPVTEDDFQSQIGAAGRRSGMGR
jgi:hypothetical protein